MFKRVMMCTITFLVVGLVLSAGVIMVKTADKAIHAKEAVTHCVTERR